MKFLAFLFAVVLSLSFAVNSFAVDMQTPEIIPAESVSETVVPDEPDNDYLDLVLEGIQDDIRDLTDKVEVLEDDLSELGDVSSVPDVSDVPDDEFDEFNPETELPVSVSVMSVSPIKPEDTSGLKSVLLSVLGDYDPIVVEYQYQNNNQTSYQYLREVMPDYPWCASFVMLSLFVYCLFRLGGALFRG